MGDTFFGVNDVINKFVVFNPSIGPLSNFAHQTHSHLKSIAESLSSQGIKQCVLNAENSMPFIRQNIHVIDETGACDDQSEKIVSEWIQTFVSGIPAHDNEEWLKILSHHISVTLTRVEDGPVHVKEYKITPVISNEPHSFALTASGFILGGSSSPASSAPSFPLAEKYRKNLYRFLLKEIFNIPLALELPDCYRISSRDFIPVHQNLTFVGSTYWTNEEALRTILQAGVLKSKRVAVVRDLFDRNISTRAHLDNILFIINNSTAAISKVVAGKTNTKRRLVQEYCFDEKKNKYVLTVNDMELLDYLNLLGFKVIEVLPTMAFPTLSLLSLGENKYLASPEQKELVDFYKTSVPSISIEIVADGKIAANSHNGFDLLANVVATRQPSTSQAPAIKLTSEIPVVHMPITAYTDTKPRQTTNKLLMVAPIGFLSSAQTILDNYFMNATTLPEYEVERLALAEYSNFHEALTSEGVRIALYRNERFYDTPDATFPNNWFSTHPPAESVSGKPTLFLYPMKAPSRRAERREHIVSNLLETYDQHINLTYFEYQGVAGSCLEGTGALVLDRVNKIAYCALSQRADRHIFELWCQKAGYQPCSFASADEKGRPIYHTNVIMGIGSSVAVLCADSIIDPEERKNVIKTLSKHHTVIQITHAQMGSFCGNILEVQGANEAKLMVMSTRAYEAFTPEQHEIFSRHVKKIVHVPVKTIEDIGGGGVRCMMGELF